MCKKRIMRFSERQFTYLVVFLGTSAFFFFAKSWRDLPHLAYDLISAPIVFAFVAKTILGKYTRLLLIPTIIVPIGAQFFSWPISGHLTDLIISLFFLTSRLKVFQAIMCWLFIVPVFYIRWFIFDINGHWRTYNAVIVAIACIIVVTFLSWRRKKWR